MDQKNWPAKYRPKSLDDFYGQDAAVSQVWGMLKRNPPQTLLITGPTGNGKTTLARIIALKINGNASDTHEINVSDKRAIDDIRTIVRLSKLKPKGKRRIIILDEAHGITGLSSNAILKDLEEPPAHVMYILVTNEPEKLLKTIVNRCSKIHLERIDEEAIQDCLLMIASFEMKKITEKHRDLAIDYIAKNCDGTMREAISQFSDFWDRYLGSGGKISKEQFKTLLIKKDDELIQVAIKVIAYMYNGVVDKSVTLILENKTRFNELMSSCLMLNRFVVEELTHTANRSFIPSFKQVMHLIKKEPELRTSLQYHKILTDLKNAVVFGIASDDDKLMAGLSALYRVE